MDQNSKNTTATATQEKLTLKYPCQSWDLHPGLKTTQSEATDAV